MAVFVHAPIHQEETEVECASKRAMRLLVEAECWQREGYLQVVLRFEPGELVAGQNFVCCFGKDSMGEGVPRCETINLVGSACTGDVLARGFVDLPTLLRGKRVRRK